MYISLYIHLYMHEAHRHGTHPCVFKRFLECMLEDFLVYERISWYTKG